MSALKSTALQLYRMYVLRPKAQVEFLRPVWMWCNRGARALYEAHKPKLSELQQRIVDGVKKEGIYITHIDALFADMPEIYAGMQETLPSMLEHAVQDHKKAHFKILWNSRFFHLDPKSPFVRFALAERMVDIANAYFGMWTRLILSNGYVAEPEPKKDKVNSQNWHRDLHDVQLMSVFLYLTDVETEEDGAFWFVKGTHAYGDTSLAFKQRKPYSTRKTPPENEILPHIREEDKMLCLGKKGTLIFCDATGLHRGGHCTENRRIMILTDYASNHRFSKTLRLSYPEDANELSELTASLSPQVLYAASLE